MPAWSGARWRRVAPRHTGIFDEALDLRTRTLTSLSMSGETKRGAPPHPTLLQHNPITRIG